MHASRGSSWKLWIVIIALALAIIVLGFLCIHFFLGDGGLLRSTPTAENNLSTQASAQDVKGKNVSDKIAVSAGTLRPDTVAADAELTLLDIDWTGKKGANYPLIITVSDESFPDNDGLSVYHCADGVWELLGTYLIENHSVSFQADSLSPFAFQVISSTPEPTALTDAYAVMKAYSMYASAPNLKLVVNRVYNEAESREVVAKLQQTSERFLHLPLECMGYIFEDQDVMKAVRNQKPFMISNPSGTASRCIKGLASSLLYGSRMTVKKGWRGFLQQIFNFSH